METTKKLFSIHSHFGTNHTQQGPNPSQIYKNPTFHNEFRRYVGMYSFYHIPHYSHIVEPLQQLQNQPKHSYSRNMNFQQQPPLTLFIVRRTSQSFRYFWNSILQCKYSSTPQRRLNALALLPTTLIQQWESRFTRWQKTVAVMLHVYLAYVKRNYSAFVKKLWLLSQRLWSLNIWLKEAIPMFSQTTNESQVHSTRDSLDNCLF